MSHPFKPFELHILEILLADEFSKQELLKLLESASTIQVEYTNYGFYVTVGNPGFGKNRRVFHSVRLIGRLQSMDAGFVVFLDDGHLTLEIHPWGDGSLPPSFRDGDVQLIQATSSHET